MTAAAARTVVQVDFRRPAPLRPIPASTGRIPRVARLLSLAHRLDQMIAAGEIRDWAEAARLCGLTRARISQIASTVLLAPAIQEAVLDLPPVTTGRDPVTEHQLRQIVAESDWARQIAIWNDIKGRAA